MANNPYVNKVVYGNNTLIDLTADTVTADKLAQGYTAHDSSGAAITGTMSGVNIDTKTASLSSVAYSISFTGLTAEPKAFFVISTETLNPTSSSGAYITAVEYDGDSVEGSRLRTASNRAVLVHTEDVYTFSYSNGTLTITNPEGSASSGRFYYGYKLTYIY